MGVQTSKDVSFSVHIDDIVLSSKIKVGLLARSFITRKATPMLEMFNSYIRSKIEYCNLIWNIQKKEDINKLERIQKNFTSKIVGLEEMDYHERVKKLGLYRLKRR